MRTPTTTTTNHHASKALPQHVSMFAWAGEHVTLAAATRPLFEFE